MKILSFFFSLKSEFSHSYFNYVTITSCWVIREITRFNITICKFARESLGSYKAYPRGVRGKHNIVNPNVHENFVLIAIASFFHLKTKP